PLWIIALSLLIIAACLVIDSIERQRRAGDGALPPVAAISDAQPAAMPDHHAVKMATRSRREPPVETPENPVPADKVPEDAAAASVAVLPAARSAVGGAQPVGYSISGISQGTNP